jgi:hypothetical protein
VPCYPVGVDLVETDDNFSFVVSHDSLSIQRLNFESAEPTPTS